MHNVFGHMRYNNNKPRNNQIPYRQNCFFDYTDHSHIIRHKLRITGEDKTHINENKCRLTKIHERK